MGESIVAFLLSLNKMPGYPAQWQITTAKEASPLRGAWEYAPVDDFAMQYLNYFYKQVA